MDKLLLSYKAYLENTASENTVLSYMGDLVKFIREYSIVTKKELTALTGDKVEEYISLLKSRGMAYTSISRTVASLKKFFNYCTAEGVITADLTEKIDIPQSKRKLPNTITSEEVVKLLEAPDESTVKGIRDKAMLELMYATGARVSELITLKVGDVSLKNEIVILTNGGKHRFVPLGKAAIEAMLIYLKDGRSSLVSDESSDVLFLNFYGQPLTRQGFWKIIKRYIKETGIKGNVTAQTIRHSFALHLLKNGADVHSVSEMLGYSDVSSTKIYIDVMNNKIKEVYHSAHPRA